MDKLIQTLISGLSLGSIYALIALGYTMVYGIAKMLNFAHGDIIMVGGYISFCAISYLGLPSWVSVLLAMVVCTVLGAVISYATFSRGKGKDDRSDGRQIGTVLTELGYIKSNTDEIKAEQREQRKVNTTVEGRLAAVESSAKSAHHRIDRLEGVAHEEA